MDQPDSLSDRAHKLAPALAERARATEENRAVLPETIREFQEAGLFKALQPSRFGGDEADPIDFFDAVLEVASMCGSSAWVLSVVAVHSWQLALFPLEAQEDVWAGDETVLISSSYAPTGTVTRVEGGFELSGRWSFSSGCDHAGWAFLGGVVPKDAHGPQVPDMRTFLIPRSDYRIDDVWYVAGLGGSGSKDIVVDRAFVPEYRTHSFADVLRMESPGNLANAGSLFKLPFGGMFCYAIAVPALGVAQGALAGFRERCQSRVAQADPRAPEAPFDQLELAEGSAALDAVHLQVRRNFQEMTGHAQAGTQPTLERRAWYRWNAARTTRIAAQVVDGIFAASGGHAIALSHPLQQKFRDVHAMQAHANNAWQKAAQVFARADLGYPNREFLL